MVSESELRARGGTNMGSCIKADVVFLFGCPFSGWQFVGKMWLAVDMSGMQGIRLQNLHLVCCEACLLCFCSSNDQYF